MRTPPGAAGGPRLAVPDALRGAAILAMLVAHAVPFLPQLPGAVRFVLEDVNDVASPLFALVMGMSAQLVTRRTVPSDRARMLLQQCVRALVLVALGVWLAGWGSWVAVVLGHLGVLLLVGAPLLLLPTRWLTGLTVALALLAAPVASWARSELLWAVADPEAPLGRVASWLVLGQQYRVTNLLPFFLLGALLLRRGLGRGPLLWTMLALAPVAYLVLPVLLRLRPATDVSSGSLPDTLHDLGLVLLAVVVVVLLADRLTPLRLVGTVALSLYVLHVGVLALWAPDGLRPATNDHLGWLVLVPGMLAVGYAWARLVGTGPLEWLLGLVTGRRRPGRRPPGRRPPGAGASPPDVRGEPDPSPPRPRRTARGAAARGRPR